MKLDMAAKLALCSGLLLSGAPALAHHGTGFEYDQTKRITLSGVVTDFAFSYPHPQLYFDVTIEGGKVQHWGADFAPTPLMLKKSGGWTRTSVKPGDQIVMICAPHKKPGATACLARELTVNGKKLAVGMPQPVAAEKQP